MNRVTIPRSKIVYGDHRFPTKLSILQAAKESGVPVIAEGFALRLDPSYIHTVDFNPVSEETIFKWHPAKS